MQTYVLIATALLITTVAAAAFMYFYNLVYKGYGSQKNVYRRIAKGAAITFDDGPSQHTGYILDVLKRKKAKAAFFFVGRNALKQPYLVKRAAKEGHIIGCHTFNHTTTFCRRNATLENEIFKTKELIESIAGKPVRYFRPPRGIFDQKTRAMLTQRKLPMVLWTLSSKDWSGISERKITSNILSAVKNGDVLLFHDTKPNTALAIEEIIDGIRKKGLRIVPLHDLKS